MRRAPIGSMLLVALGLILVVVGGFQIHDIKQQCNREHGLLVHAPYPDGGFWGYACIEKGQHR